jgi:ABC-type polysaccharide/polyol phosphate transport system ATPase subunit
VRGVPADDVAVSADGVSKTFRLPQERISTLKERVLHPARRQRFDDLRALRDVSFEVRRGEVFGIVGRNGSGKSTLMKCLAGIYQADTGEMWLRGRMAPFIELGVGFNPDLTAHDNVLINAVMLGLTPEQARGRYDSIMDFAELHEFSELKLKNYSSGMQVRLAFSVMVHVDADLLLIDEVLAVGDAAFQQKCYDVLNRSRDEGRTILLVTHDMDQVRRFCDRAMLLEHGAIVAIGDSDEVAQRYTNVNFALRSDVATRPELPVGETDEGAHILDVFMQDTARRRGTVAQGGSVAICMRVRFAQPVSDPVFEVALIDARGNRVLDVSSASQQPATGEFDSGDLIEVWVSFDNWFAPGRYDITPQVTYPGSGHRIMAVRDKASSVVITGTHGGGMVDVPHAFQINRAERAGGAAAERAAL